MSLAPGRPEREVAQREPGPGPRLGRVLAPEATVEQLILLASLFWALSANRAFFSAALHGRNMAEASTWTFGAAMFLMVLALQLLLLALVANRWTVKPLLALLTLATASAGYYMNAYGVVLDPSMLRNVLRTDVAEARELLGSAWLVHLLLYAAAPLLLLWRVQVVRRPWRRAGMVRLGTLLLAAAVLVGAVLAESQPFASLMRNPQGSSLPDHPGQPSGVAGQRGRGGSAWCRVAAPGHRCVRRSRAILGRMAQTVVVVLVVGETARAANWGLNGYARQTTPQLARAAWC